MIAEAASKSEAMSRDRLERLVGVSALHSDHRNPELARPLKQRRRHLPVSDATPRQRGGFANSSAIACAVDAVFLSRTTTPSRSRTQTWVSCIERSPREILLIGS